MITLNHNLSMAHNKCNVCSIPFTNWNQYKEHQRTCRRVYKPMDPILKAEIVTRVENNLEKYIIK